MCIYTQFQKKKNKVNKAKHWRKCEPHNESSPASARRGHLFEPDNDC
jgi:hypothetical protein